MSRRCMQSQNLHLGLFVSAWGLQLLEQLHQLQQRLEGWFSSPLGDSIQ